MERIIQLKDIVNGEESFLYPKTKADAIDVNGVTLTKKIKELSRVQVEEDGFYVTDENGNIISKYNSEGGNFIFSPLFEDGVKVIVDKSIDSKFINANNVERVNTYKRVTDSGIISSEVYLSVINIGDLTIGEKTIKISAPNYIFTDYFKFSSNAPLRLKNRVFNGKNITITVESDIDINDVTLFVEYSTISEFTHDKISYKIKTAADIATVTPYFPSAKFNKKFPLVYITDDMGVGDFSGIWCVFNGYAVGTQPHATPADAEGILNGYWGNAGMLTHTPYQYSDGIGGMRRFGFSCAIWPELIDNVNYTKFNRTHALIMSRLNTSFTFHDLDCTTMQSIRNDVTRYSKIWGEAIYNNDLKIMTEPNGLKMYIKAVQSSPEVCLALSQNEGRFIYYVDDDGNEVFKNYSDATADEILIGEDVNIKGYKKDIASWKSGRDYTSFKRKPNGSLIREFIQSWTKENLLDSINANTGNNAIIYGNHGMSDVLREGFSEIAATRDDIWICSVDEFWEYYHLANNTIIGKLKRDGDYITFDVYIPKYGNSQFREINLNIPVTDCTECTMSSNVITGGWKQNESYLTIISGLEEKHYKYVSDAIKLAGKYPENSNIKNDAQYLINMLNNGAAKDSFQSNLNSIYSTT